MAPHSSTLAWRIPWREEPGRLNDSVIESMDMNLSRLVKIEEDRKA